MKSLGRNIIQISTITAIADGAGMRSTLGIDPQWSHTIAQPAL